MTHRYREKAAITRLKLELEVRQLTTYAPSITYFELLQLLSTHEDAYASNNQPPMPEGVKDCLRKPS